MDADRAMLLDQLNQLMSEAAGDAETMEMYKVAFPFFHL